MDKNLETYSSKHIVKWYAALDFMFPAERAVFDRYQDHVSAANFLDIGIGGGRTTAWLLPRCKNYTGIDYSQNFIEAAQKKYPAAALSWHDARDLSFYNAATFDFVHFSFNGMDYVDLPGREKIISEAYRVLKPNGMFFFSTHNRNHSSFNEWPWNTKKITTLIKIKTFVKLIPFLIRKVLNQKFELQNSDYAIINDSANNYSLMTFYTSPQFLREHLARTGFTSIVFYDNQGRPTPDEQLSDYIYATAIKSTT